MMRAASRRRARLREAGWVAAGVVLGALGCAGPGTPGSSRGGATSPAPLEFLRAPRLADLASREAAEPDAESRALGVPPGVDESAVRPLAPNELAPGSLAQAGLEQTLASLRSGDAEGAETPDNPPDMEDSSDYAPLDAMAAFARARLAVLQGDAATALREFESASRLDPKSPEVRRELGLLQLRVGRRSQGVRSLRQALALGLKEARVTWLVARDQSALDAGDDGWRALASLLTPDLRKDDPALWCAVGNDLVERWTQSGRVRAAAELCRALAAVPTSEVLAARSGAEAGEFLRQRPNLWVRAGDYSCRLGNYEQALADYARAREARALDEASVTARSTHALLRLGRPAHAALALVADIRAADGLADERHAQLAAFLAAHTRVGPSLAAALTEMSESAGSGGSRAVRAGLVRLAAAAAPAQSARLLTAWMERNGARPELLRDLMDAAPPDEWEDSLNDLLAIVRAHGKTAEACADAILADGQAVDAMARAASGQSSREGRLLSNALLRRLGRSEEALARLGEPQAGDDVAVILARVATLAGVGRFEEAAQVALGLPQGDTEALDRAIALDTMGRVAEAILESDLWVSTGPSDVDGCLVAAALAARAGDGAACERALKRAMEVDPREEMVYESLLALHQSGGLLPDEARLAQTVRTLRTQIPSSRVVRLFLAQEQLQRGLVAQAEHQLSAMLDDRGEPRNVLAALVGMWERAATDDRARSDAGEAWLRDAAARRPQSTPLLLALTRMLVAQGKAQEALGMLDHRLVAWPIDELRAQKEFVLRTGLGRAEEADRLAMERLAAAPRDFDTAVALADLMLRTGRASDAVRVLATDIPAGPLGPQQVQQLAGLLARARPESLSQLSADEAEAVIGLFDLLAKRGVALTPQMESARLGLLVRYLPDRTALIIETINRLEKKSEAYGRAALQQAMLALLGMEDVGPSLRFLGALTKRGGPDGENWGEMWRGRTAVFGSVDDALWMVEQIDSVDLARLVFIQGRPLGDPPIQLTTTQEHRAEVAYQLATFAQTMGRERMAERLYREALRLYPVHPWAANNLGYLILDRGGDLDEAERLIEGALRQLADSPNVIDSLGWVRYKRGMLSDEAGAEPGKREGALTLLERASTTGDGATNAEIHEHLGDALWRLGKQPEALKAWGQGLILVREQLTDEESFKGVFAAQGDLLKEARDRLARKIGGAPEVKEPDLAPLSIPEVFTPRPEPARPDPGAAANADGSAPEQVQP